MWIIGSLHHKISETRHFKNKFHWNTEKPKNCAYISTEIVMTSDNSADKKSHIRYTCLWHVCFPMQKVLEENYRQLATGQTYFRLLLSLLHDTKDFGFIPVSLVEMNKYIEVADGHFVTSKNGRS